MRSLKQPLFPGLIPGLQHSHLQQLQAECEEITKKQQFSVCRAIHPMKITTLPSLLLDPTSPLLSSPPLAPLHQIVFLPQINKHYQRVTDYGLVEAASVSYRSGRSVSITAWATRPRGDRSIPVHVCNIKHSQKKMGKTCSIIRQEFSGSAGIHFYDHARRITKRRIS